MRCLKCGYRLDGLADNRCPECGEAFDPDRVDEPTSNGVLIFFVVCTLTYGLCFAVVSLVSGWRAPLDMICCSSFVLMVLAGPLVLLAVIFGKLLLRR